MIVYTLGDYIDQRGISLYKIWKKSQVAGKPFGYPTLLRIRHNRSQRVETDVLNRLCAILGCKPGDLIDYVPDEKDSQLRLDENVSQVRKKKSGRKRGK